MNALEDHHSLGALQVQVSRTIARITIAFRQSTRKIAELITSRQPPQSPDKSEQFQAVSQTNKVVSDESVTRNDGAIVSNHK